MQTNCNAVPSRHTPSPPPNPSQFRGHLTYLQGAATETIGKITASPGLKSSGQAKQQVAISEMRAAKEKGDETLDLDNRNLKVLQTEGKAQELAGKVTGCPGMFERGETKGKFAERRESQ
ncbi:hypothetical protein RUND412_007406 [Rhizina undulata]